MPSNRKTKHPVYVNRIKCFPSLLWIDPKKSSYREGKTLEQDKVIELRLMRLALRFYFFKGSRDLYRKLIFFSSLSFDDEWILPEFIPNIWVTHLRKLRLMTNFLYKIAVIKHSLQVFRKNNLSAEKNYLSQKMRLFLAHLHSLKRIVQADGLLILYVKEGREKVLRAMGVS